MQLSAQINDDLKGAAEQQHHSNSNLRSTGSGGGKRAIMQKNQYRLRKETRRSIESLNESASSFVQRPTTKGSKKGSCNTASRENHQTNSRIVQQVYNQPLVPKKNTGGFSKELGGGREVSNSSAHHLKRSSSSKRLKRSLQNRSSSKGNIISHSYAQVKEQYSSIGK